MIAYEIKSLFQQPLDAKNLVFVNAFINAEWQRRKLEFELEHDFHNGERCLAIPNCHKWTDSNWRDSVLAELNEP